MILVGPPGTGKSKAITSAQSYAINVDDLCLGATSMTMAAMVDIVSEETRYINEGNTCKAEYNSIYTIADEMSAFMHKEDKELVAGLTQFYDVNPYSQRRRVGKIDKQIQRPQASILCGTTPSALIHLVPDYAWDQGFTSRLILIYASDKQKPYVNIFAKEMKAKPQPPEMVHDLRVMRSLYGHWQWTKACEDALNNWRAIGLAPRPEHPRLAFYNERRFSHMLKLSLISSVDRGASEIDTVDFDRAMNWLVEAEAGMPSIFSKGAFHADGKVMAEIVYWVKSHGEKGVNHQRVINYAKDRLPAYSVNHVMSMLELSGSIKVIALLKTGEKVFGAGEGDD